VSSHPRAENFLADGAAVALAGRLNGLAPPGSREPEALDLALQIEGGSAALATTAGHSRSRAPGAQTTDKHGRVVARFESAMASASHETIPQRTTTLETMIERLEIDPDGAFGHTTFRIGRGRLKLRSTHYGRSQREFEILHASVEHVDFERVDRDASGKVSRRNHRLNVTFATTPPEDRAPLSERADRLCLRSFRDVMRARKHPTVASSFLPHSPLRPSSWCLCCWRPRYAGRHIVLPALAWENKDDPYPGATLGPNHVHIPGFGTVHFGEVYDADQHRVVTLARLALGCPIRGDASALNARSNYGDWPP
jgi:hypothetical protein